MKKIIKKLTVLVCAMVLALMPVSSAFAATQVPTVGLNVPGVVKMFNYNPYLVEYPDGTPTELKDITTSSGEFYAPAGKAFRFQVTTDNNDLSMVIKISSKTSGVKAVRIMTPGAGSFYLDIPAQSYDDYYDVIVDSYGTVNYIMAYGCIYLNW